MKRYLNILSANGTLPITELPVGAAFAWCTRCDAAFRDVDESNAHHEATGHVATSSYSASWEAMRGR